MIRSEQGRDLQRASGWVHLGETAVSKRDFSSQLLCESEIYSNYSNV